MTPVSTNIKIDPILKRQAQSLFDDLGLNLSVAVNMFLKQAVREQAIPFRVGDPFYSESNIKHLKTVISDIESGRAVLKEHELIED